MVQLWYNGKVNNKKNIEVKCVFINVFKRYEYIHEKSKLQKCSLEIFSFNPHLSTCLLILGGRERNIDWLPFLYALAGDLL